MSEYAITSAQARVWAVISKSYQAHRFGSTYLICGPEGYGHWSLALAITALVNCEKVELTDGLMEPCGICRTCRLIAAVNFEGFQAVAPIKSHKKPDDALELTAAFFESKRQEPFGLLDTSSAVTIPIDLAREVKRSLAQKATEGITRVALFYCMDRMKPAATDALLKLIEEPPQNTIVILTSEFPDSLTPTILSRARKITLDPLPESFVVEYLTTRYKVSESRARLLSRISNRNLGRAIALSGADEDDESSDRAVGLLLFKSLFDEQSPGMIGLLTEFMADADSGQASELIRLWSSLLRDCVAYAGTGRDDDLVNIDFLPELKRIAHHFDNPQVAASMGDIFKITLADLGRNVHIHPALAAMALRLQSCVRATA